MTPVASLAKRQKRCKNNGGKFNARSGAARGIREHNKRCATIKPECRGAPRSRETPKFSSRSSLEKEDVFAIYAVLCFDASRFGSRVIIKKKKKRTKRRILNERNRNRLRRKLNIHVFARNLQSGEKCRNIMFVYISKFFYFISVCWCKR